MKFYSLLLTILFFSTVGVGQTKPPENKFIKRYRAEEIHKSVIKIDTHNDIDVRNFTKEINYTQDLNTQLNLPKMMQGGLDVTWLIVYTRQEELNKKGYTKAYQNAMDKFDAIHRLTEIYAPDQIELALTSDDVRRIHKKGKKVAMIGVENAYPIANKLSRIEEFYDLGARYMSLPPILQPEASVTSAVI